MGFSDHKRYQEQYVTSMKSFAEEAAYLGVPTYRLETALSEAIRNGRRRAEDQAREARRGRS